MTKLEFNKILNELDEVSPYVGVDLLKPKLDTSNLSFNNFEEIINTYRDSIGDVYDTFEEIRKDKEKLKLFIYGEIFLINELSMQVRENKRSEDYIHLIEVDKTLLSLINLLKDGKYRTASMIEEEIGISPQNLIMLFKRKPYYYDFIDKDMIGKRYYYTLSNTGNEYAEKIDIKNNSGLKTEGTIRRDNDLLKKVIALNEEFLKTLKSLENN